MVHVVHAGLDRECDLVGREVQFCDLASWCIGRIRCWLEEGGELVECLDTLRPEWITSLIQQGRNQLSTLRRIQRLILKLATSGRTASDGKRREGKVGTDGLLGGDDGSRGRGARTCC